MNKTDSNSSGVFSWSTAEPSSFAKRQTEEKERIWFRAFGASADSRPKRWTSANRRIRSDMPVFCTCSVLPRITSMRMSGQGTNHTVCKVPTSAADRLRPQRGYALSPDRTSGTTPGKAGSIHPSENGMYRNRHIHPYFVIFRNSYDLKPLVCQGFNRHHAGQSQVTIGVF